MDKTVVMFFTRSRINIPDQINTDICSIKVVNSYKYLGVIIDKKLLWKEHIQYTTRKCERGINLLRATVAQDWGADIHTALMFYRSYIRSTIDYGCIVFGSTSKTNFKQIERIQLKALRICLGAMLSTPCSIIFAESGEHPFHIRLNMLTRRFLSKLRFQRSTDDDTLHKLYLETLSNRFWRVKNKPPLAVGYYQNLKYEQHIITDIQVRTPIEYDILLTKLRVIIPSYYERPELNNIILHE